jgi:hypothetical protein
MVVRLKKDQFTAGDMTFMVRSRRRAKPTAGFYGAAASEKKSVLRGGTTMNPTSKVVKAKEEEDNTESSGAMEQPNKSLFKDSDEYYDSKPTNDNEEVEPVQIVEAVEAKSLEAMTNEIKERSNLLEKEKSLKRSYKKVKDMNVISLDL